MLCLLKKANSINSEFLSMLHPLAWFSEQRPIRARWFHCKPVGVRSRKEKRKRGCSCLEIIMLSTTLDLWDSASYVLFFLMRSRRRSLWSVNGLRIPLLWKHTEESTPWHVGDHHPCNFSAGFLCWPNEISLICLCFSSAHSQPWNRETICWNCQVTHKSSESICKIN